MLFRVLFLLVVSSGFVVRAAEEQSAKPEAVTAEREEASKPPAQGAEKERFVLSDDVRDVLQPLFASIADADVSRATVELSTDSVLAGQIVETKKSTYQIASKHPDQFTIYLKEPEQRTRIYCDGKKMVVALSPKAYYQISEPLDLQDAVLNLPLPMGPYPEPVMALTFAGVDPSLSFLGGMKSVSIVDREKFRGRVPAIHLRGEQNDAVTWDFWVSEEKVPKPIRLLVDLTAMLRATNQVRVPQGFAYQLQFDFLSWRVTGEVEESLFSFHAGKDAVEYESLEDYMQSIAGAVNSHPLLGEMAPDFEASTLAGDVVSLDALKNKVVVLDFWATWCVPCAAAMPILKQVSDEYADKDVVFLAVNVGEDESLVKGFLEEQEWDINVVFDPKGKISDAYRADAIPQTVVVGKTGIIESVHLGFPGEDELRKRLNDELSVLSIGGRIESGNAAEAAEEPTEEPSIQETDKQ
ncbi:redoxin domain-containing protein [Novipirellula artificiosorum]|uniref:Thiol-disulfide oxidoreductase ResA n=1 Tax=Novipirellula artificiosorum TaxID=2528016 RepID=A0A5C6DW76_9BACT|nr:redoxin domain-containing protein [Novipirellula artificiosorum]TWU40918.1 Thiol-disulfide oxidoreductase ResA [Novipirellula artificiosorum]